MDEDRFYELAISPYGQKTGSFDLYAKLGALEKNESVRVYFSKIYSSQDLQDMSGCYMETIKKRIYVWFHDMRPVCRAKEK